MCQALFTDITSSNPHGEVNTVITLMLQVRKRRQREVKNPAHGHAALDRGLNNRQAGSTVHASEHNYAQPWRKVSDSQVAWYVVSLSCDFHTFKISLT